MVNIFLSDFVKLSKNNNSIGLENPVRIRLQKREAHFFHCTAFAAGRSLSYPINHVISLL